MRKLLLASVAIMGMTTGASANVIYTFETTSGFGPDIRLELTSADTSFNLSGNFSLLPFPSNLVGDVNRFVSLVALTDVPVLGGDRRVSLSLRFNPGGNVTSSFVRYFGDTESFELSGGPGPTAGGTYFSDYFPNCPVTTMTGCSFSGIWRSEGPAQPVPEPMSLALFGIGLAGLGVVRRRTA